MYYDIVIRRGSLGETVTIKKKPATTIVTGVPQPSHLVTAAQPFTGRVAVTATGTKGLYKPLVYNLPPVTGVITPKIYVKPPVIGTTKPEVYIPPPTGTIVTGKPPIPYQPPPFVEIIAPPAGKGLPPTITVPSTPIITPTGAQVEVPAGQAVQVVTPSGRVATVDAATVAASQPAQQATILGIDPKWLLIGAVAIFVLPNLLKGGGTRTRTVYRQRRRRKR